MNAVVSEIGGIQVAVEARLVEAVDADEEVDPDDVAARFGVDGGPSRRRLRSRGRDLLVGDRAVVEPIEHAQPFPLFLAGVARRLGASGVFLRDGRFGILLDVAPGAPT